MDPEDFIRSVRHRYSVASFATSRLLESLPYRRSKKLNNIWKPFETEILSRYAQADACMDLPDEEGEAGIERLCREMDVLITAYEKELVPYMRFVKWPEYCSGCGGCN